jgi:hypothetical protein
VLALGAVALVAAAATAVVLMGGENGEKEDGQKVDENPVFVARTHQIEYEVTAATPGAAAETIDYIVGANNKIKTVEAPSLPFRISLPLEVGPGGGIAQITAANGGAAALSCVVKVDGKVAYAVTAPNETDVGCSTEIAPATR